MAWYDLSGYAGVGLILLLFLLLQAGKLDGNAPAYQILNIAGATGIILSLLFGAFNLPALLQEVAWIAIGIYGLARSRRPKIKLNQ